MDRSPLRPMQQNTQQCRRQAAITDSFVIRKRPAPTELLQENIIKKPALDDHPTSPLSRLAHQTKQTHIERYAIQLPSKHCTAVSTAAPSQPEDELSQDSFENHQLSIEQRHVPALPLSLPVKGINQTISAATLSTLLRADSRYALHPEAHIQLVDCRYPYEFEAGHIRGAVNIWHQEDMEKILFDNASLPHNSSAKLDVNKVLIFYCEYSSERAPKMWKAARKYDRARIGMARYPAVHYPEMYVLRGGYSQFFPTFPELCDPQAYRKMDESPYKRELHRCERVRKRGVTRIARTHSARRLPRHSPTVVRSISFNGNTSTYDASDDPIAFALNING